MHAQTDPRPVCFRTTLTTYAVLGASLGYFLVDIACCLKHSVRPGPRIRFQGWEIFPINQEKGEGDRAHCYQVARQLRPAETADAFADRGRSGGGPLF
jgi:hypothetical protein